MFNNHSAIMFKQNCRFLDVFFVLSLVSHIAVKALQEAKPSLKGLLTNC